MSIRRLLAYAAIYFLWGGTYLTVRTVVLATPPFSAAAIRFLLSGLILLGISRAERQPWPTRAEWLESAKLGFAMFTINYACFFWAEQRLYSATASVIVATMPVWIVFAEGIAARRLTFSGATLVGSTLGIGGIALVSFTGKAVATPQNQTHLAAVVLLAGTIAWSAGSVWSRALKLPAQQTVRSALQMTTGGLFLGILAFAAGEAPRLPAALRLWTLTTLLCFLYLIFASIVAFTAYVWLLHREPAGRVASYAYVNPLVALALGIGLAHESITAWQIAGVGLVLVGVFFTLRPQERLLPADSYSAETQTAP